MTVHDIQMEKIDAGSLCIFDTFRQVGKIGSQN
jgi:hypothetical protein